MDLLFEKLLYKLTVLKYAINYLFFICRLTTVYKSKCYWLFCHCKLTCCKVL